MTFNLLLKTDEQSIVDDLTKATKLSKTMEINIDGRLRYMVVQQMTVQINPEAMICEASLTTETPKENVPESPEKQLVLPNHG